MRVLVCGARDATIDSHVWNILHGLIPIIDVLIVGDAPGIDEAARRWGKFYLEGKMEVYKADWDKHGRAAGPIRNQRMLDEGKPDLVIAFPGGKGTADMIRRAKKAGVEVRII